MAGESLRRICRTAGIPNVASVYRWLAAKPEFQERYAAAREAQADATGDLVLEIADDSSGDWKRRLVGGVWKWTVDHENIERSRLRCDTLKWLMARLAPKKYGKRLWLVGGSNRSGVTINVSAYILDASALRLGRNG